MGGLAGNLVGDAVAGIVGEVAGSEAANIAGAITGVVAAGTVAAVSTELLGDLRSKMFSKLSPQMQTSFKSMSLLTQSIETSSGGGFSSGSKMDPISFLTNAADLLGQCGNLGDMVQCLQMLQYDTSLHGLDKLPSVSFSMSTPFGIPMPMTLDPTGAITSLIPKPLQAAIDLFSKSAAAFPGVNPGENLFGGSAGTMLNMFNRLSGPSQAKAIAMAKILNTSPTALNFDKALKLTVGAGNPLTILLK